MSAPTLARDADGRVALSTEQARLLAEWTVSDDYCEGTEVVGAIHDLGDGAEYTSARALARWVLRWAPVVEAAIAQHNAHVTIPDDYSGEWIDDREWIGACSATEAAVRAVLGEKAAS